MGLLDSTTQQAYYQGNDHGNYQFTSLDDIISQFMIVYVGEEKIIPRAKRLDVAFHAQRAMQELSFDTFKSIKAQEITVPPSLQMILPQDYVNYTKISWVDSAGIKHLLYPTSKTSNPTNQFQNSDGLFNQTYPLLHPSQSTLMSATITNGSMIVVLDSVYHNIPIGSIVSGPSIGKKVVLSNSIDASGFQILGFVDDDLQTLTYYVPTSSFTETLTVTRVNELLDSTDVRTPAITGPPCSLFE